MHGILIIWRLASYCFWIQPLSNSTPPMACLV